jgi:hypothetical protein
MRELHIFAAGFPVIPQKKMHGKENGSFLFPPED